MSRNDYTKYSKENRTEASEIEVDVEPIPVETEPVVEVNVEAEPVIEIPEKPEPVVETPRKMARVFGCAKLNVRKSPNPKADVVCEISCGVTVEIDEANSTSDFYKIYTASGIEGYCMKTYIIESFNK